MQQSFSRQAFWAEERQDRKPKWKPKSALGARKMFEAMQHMYDDDGGGDDDEEDDDDDGGGGDDGGGDDDDDEEDGDEEEE